MVAISIIIRKSLEKCYAFTRRVYVLTVFDTNKKSLLQQTSAEKGLKSRASEAPHQFDASFGCPFSVYSVHGVGCLFRIYLPYKIGSQGIIKKCGKIKRYELPSAFYPTKDFLDAQLRFFDFHSVCSTLCIFYCAL
jgi:hypothetical protein